jgi:soluble lytic murein transglycosylase-like protein
MGVCAGLVLAGAAGELWLHHELLPKVAPRLKDPANPQVNQKQLEQLLDRAAHQLDPQLRSRLADAVLGESGKAGYDPLFILALVSVESRFRISVSSDRGAYGLMQMKPSTFAWIAGREPDLDDDAAVAEDPVLDVRLAVRYFRWLEHRFHDRDEALMAYNAGPRRLQQYKKTAIPESLREYPKRVMREYNRFVKMVGTGVDIGGVMIARNIN